MNVEVDDALTPELPLQCGNLCIARPLTRLHVPDVVVGSSQKTGEESHEVRVSERLLTAPRGGLCHRTHLDDVPPSQRIWLPLGRRLLCTCRPFMHGDGACGEVRLLPKETFSAASAGGLHPLRIHSAMITTAIFLSGYGPCTPSPFVHTWRRSCHGDTSSRESVNCRRSRGLVEISRSQ